MLATIEEHGLTAEAILLTHTHFDHVGAVAEVARATGAPVNCPELEVEVLADINRFVRFPGFGPFESYDADETVAGGERLDLAGFDIDVLFIPGHSPGHVTYSFADERRAISGDVLFEGSIGRTDLPGGDHQTLLASIAMLLDPLPRRHPGATPATWGPRRSPASARRNPFLQELARVSRRIQAPRGTYDVLGETALAREHVERDAQSVLERAGYGRIETPTFEATELFARGVGEATDIVQKEMYTFDEGRTARSRCARRAPRRSAAPTSSTGCTSSRSR